MKVQCSCGAKFAFDATPEMAREPVHFNCPSCGADISEPLNVLLRQQFGVTDVPEPVAAGTASAHGSAQQGAPLRVKRQPATPIRVDLPNRQEAEAGQICIRHPEYYTSDKCYICQKPICPKCMELFGYLCSPLCKARANSHGIVVPVF